MVNFNPSDKIPIPEIKPTAKYVMEEIISHVNRYVDRAPLILEAGCGNRSIVSRRLRKENNKLIIHGVDINKYVLNNKDIDKIFIANVENMPFEDNSYDVIMAHYMLEHLENYQVAVLEMLRVLDKGGILLLIFPNPTSIEALAARLTPFRFHVLFRKYIQKHRYADKNTFPTYFSFKSVKNIRKFIEENGRGGEVRIAYFSETYYRFRHWRILGRISIVYVTIISMLKISTLKSSVVLIVKK